jgi:chromosomal replication initiation ATPase DnaA
MSSLALTSVTKCCVAMGVAPEIARSISRSGPIVAARRVICHVMHNVYGFSFPEIYRGFHGRGGNGSHTGIREMAMRGRELIEASDPKYVEKARLCTEALRDTLAESGRAVTHVFNPAVAARFFVDALDGEGTWDELADSERSQYVEAMKTTGRMLDSMEQTLTGKLAGAMGITLQELVRLRRTKSVARRRQVLAYVLRTHAGMTCQDIADQLGGIDHTSVVHATRAVTDQIAKHDDVTLALIERCMPVLADARKEAA